MARRRITTGRRGTRRPNIWGGATTGVETAIAAGATTVFTVLSNTAVKARTSPTLSRIRGMVAIRGAAGTFVQVGAGIIVAEEKAIAAGAASLPDPDVDFEAPWLWWLNWPWRRDQAVLERHVVDSKAQRRISDSQGVVLVFKNIGTSVASVSFGLRFLLKD